MVPSDSAARGARIRRNTEAVANNGMRPTARNAEDLGGPSLKLRSFAFFAKGGSRKYRRQVGLIRVRNKIKQHTQQRVLFTWGTFHLSPCSVQQTLIV